MLFSTPLANPCRITTQKPSSPPMLNPIASSGSGVGHQECNSGDCDLGAHNSHAERRVSFAFNSTSALNNSSTGALHECKPLQVPAWFKQVFKGASYSMRLVRQISHGCEPLHEAGYTSYVISNYQIGPDKLPRVQTTP
eukprot:1152538-Pelagomonas_calceolata.AAC.2